MSEQIHQPLFGKSVIETLSTAMYNNSLFLFREYIQNSADAIDAAVKDGILGKGEGQISININGKERKISFEDNGTGIEKAGIITKLTNIGDSQKDRISNKGFRGIGRLGGLGYCEKIRFETSAKGEKTKSILEWDAHRLNNILYDNSVRMEAGDLVKEITTVKDEICDENEHFFKVTMFGINPTSNELLDIDGVKKYVSMVAPVDFDYGKFSFKNKIADFLKKNNLDEPQTYQVFLNGDQIYKGYENPLKVEDKSDIEIFEVECDLIKSDDNIIGWYWYCVTKFDGVLPGKCWQRCIRLRKSNIQIGEYDCLSNKDNGNRRLWKEDRGNNYFLGEVHALDNGLTPNSRRDYFNPGDACSRFEKTLKGKFDNLYDLYRYASTLRSSNETIKSAKQAEVEFSEKKQNGTFFDHKHEAAEQSKVEDLKRKIPDAEKKIERIKEKSSTNPVLAKIVEKFDSERRPNISETSTAGRESTKKDVYIKDKLGKIERRTLNKVFNVIKHMLPEEQANLICDAVLKEFKRS